MYLKRKPRHNKAVKAIPLQMEGWHSKFVFSAGGGEGGRVLFSSKYSIIINCIFKYMGEGLEQ